jgi:hypothetical protein
VMCAAREGATASPRDLALVDPRMPPGASRESA